MNEPLNREGFLRFSFGISMMWSEPQQLQRSCAPLLSALYPSDSADLEVVTLYTVPNTNYISTGLDALSGFRQQFRQFGMAFSDGCNSAWSASTMSLATELSVSFSLSMSFMFSDIAQTFSSNSESWSASSGWYRTRNCLDSGHFDISPFKETLCAKKLCMCAFRLDQLINLARILGHGLWWCYMGLMKRSLTL